ncbi:hypothetical protein H0O02_02400 [Candidatus Micrarchaeota archaeon]|nr:hypothetical protein [Candidatus Micrarchaeota archaeon]
MKAFKYTEEHLPSSYERQEEIDDAKQDDDSLPFFSREVPISSKRHEAAGAIEVEYSWNESKTPSIKVERMLFNRNELLGDLYRIDKRDGTDRLALEKGGRLYLFRKTSAEVAKALYNASGKIRDSVERIVGYLKSLFGTFYVISAVDGDGWTFDNRLASDRLNHIDFARLKPGHRKRLTDLIVETLSALHSQNLVLGGFTLDNVLILNNELRFTDLRKLRASRKKSFPVEEFRMVLRYLLGIGLAEKEDITAAAVYYSSENCESCREWYADKCGKKPKDEVAIASKIEQLN